MDDMISRQTAIDTLHGYFDGMLETDTWSPCDVYGLIEILPSTQPQRMIAKWIATTSLQEGQITWRDYKCSNCSHHRGKPMNFCEVCGAKMER